MKVAYFRAMSLHGLWKGACPTCKRKMILQIRRPDHPGYGQARCQCSQVFRFILST